MKENTTVVLIRDEMRWGGRDGLRGEGERKLLETMGQNEYFQSNIPSPIPVYWHLCPTRQCWQYLDERWSEGGYPPWIWLRATGYMAVATCQLQNTLFIICLPLNGAIINLMNIMLYWTRLETSDWDHTLIMKSFIKVINQIKSRVTFS